MAPGVHRLPLPLRNDALRAVNVYIVATEDGVTLIDPGWAIDEAFRALEVGLADLGYGFEDVRRALVTHMHRDHYTMAVKLRRMFGTRITAGIGEKDSISSLRNGRAGGHRSRLETWGATELGRSLAEYPRTSKDYYEYPDAWITEATTIEVGGKLLRALETPGHTRGHVVYADMEAGLLFAGDHVLPHITPSVGYEPVWSQDPLGNYLRSLDLILHGMPDMTLLPAHGPAGTRTRDRAAALIDHHRRRLAAVLGAVEVSGATVFEVARAVPWRSDLREFDSLLPPDQLLAVGETAAHLDLLVHTGQLRADHSSATSVYHRPVATADLGSHRLGS